MGLICPTISASVLVTDSMPIIGVLYHIGAHAVKYSYNAGSCQVFVGKFFENANSELTVV